jgi:hypothetical protein
LDFLKNLSLTFTVEGRRPTQQNIENYSAGPYITLLIILSRYHFRSDVIRGAKNSLKLDFI